MTADQRVWISWLFFSILTLFLNDYLFLPLGPPIPLFLSIRAPPFCDTMCARRPVAEESVVQNHTDKTGHRQEK